MVMSFMAINTDICAATEQRSLVASISSFSVMMKKKHKPVALVIEDFPAGKRAPPAGR
jgi:hypothetical protein